MDPIITKMLEGVPFNGMGSTLERNALIGVIRNLINEDKYTVDYIINYAESVGYQRQMAEDVFKELTGLSPKLIINNNAYYDMPAGVPNMCIAWGISKSNKEKAFYLVPFEYGYATMETDGINAPIPTVISATIPEAFNELKKVAKNIQTLDKIITKKLLETENVQSTANDVHQVNLPYSASPLQVLKKNFKDKVLSVAEFEKQASKLLQAEEITVDEAEDLMNWKQELVDEDESYANEVLENNEKWNEVQATVEFEDIWNEAQEMANDDNDFVGFKEDARKKFEANKDLFENVDLIEGATRLYQLLLGFSTDEILGHSKVEKKIKKDMDKKSFLIHQEKGIRDFKPWSGAKDTWKHIIEQGKADEFDNLMLDLYPDGIDETKLNDLLWFDADWIYQTLGMKNPYGEETEIDASLKKKAVDEKIKEACYYIAEQGSQDNNAEQGLEDIALEKAPKMFGVDEDILDEEWDKNRKYYFDTLFQYKNKKSATKKVKSDKKHTLSDDPHKDAFIKKMLELFEKNPEKADKLMNGVNKLRQTGDNELSEKVEKSIMKKNSSKKVTAEKLGQEEYKGFTIKYWQDPGYQGAINYKIFYNDKLVETNRAESYDVAKFEWEKFIDIHESFYKYNPSFNRSSSKKVTAENMTLEDIEAEDNKDQVTEEIDKINEKPVEEIFSENTPEEYFEDALSEDKVDTINEVVSKCIDKFSEKFKDFDKYNVQILSYNTKVLGDYEPTEDELVEDKELNANAILQVILAIKNKADESDMKKALAVFSVTNGELHWTGTVRGENDQIVAFTEEGLDSLFEVEEVADQELEDII